MGHDKLRKFAENETFPCLVQPSCSELLQDGYLSLRSHPLKGQWSSFFASLPYAGVADSKEGLVLELGCGKGEYTVDLAGRYPQSNYIGVDIKGARLWKGARQATQEHIPNVAFLRTRVEFINSFFAPGEVGEIWLTFSDPQLKKENSRLTSPLFLERYRKFLKPGGIVHLKTDSRFLHEYTKAVCLANGLKILACTDDLYAQTPVEGSPVWEVQTFYEKMSLQQGFKITYLSFTLDHEGPLRSPSDPAEFDSAHWRSLEAPRHFFGLQ